MSDYKSIVSFYERRFDEHGDTHKGLDWPNMDDLIRRYDVMLGVVRKNDEEVSLLDFGCGTAMLYEHILKKETGGKIKYAGLDLSLKFIERCKTKFPGINFYCVDILKQPGEVASFDYIVMNGVFTEKIDLSFDEMWEYFKKMLHAIFSKTIKGLAFNTMSKQVEWEKDFLFHLPLDLLADFLTKELTRNFIIRNDYGLYEYTTYVYK